MANKSNFVNICWQQIYPTNPTSINFFLVKFATVSPEEQGFPILGCRGSPRPEREVSSLTSSPFPAAEGGKQEHGKALPEEERMWRI
jgi:hypothetical protein